VKLSANQRIDMWCRWKAGQSLHEIGRAFGKDHVSIQFMFSQHGGIIPAARSRSPLTLTLAEREDISRGIASGSSIREIAKGLQRAVSTVSREVARHGGRSQYRASEADHHAWELALRPKVSLLAIQVKLQTIVASKLILDWSPEQISGWLKIEYPKDESTRVSHETIYRSLFIQARGVLKKELIQHLRTNRRIRRSRHSSDRGHRSGQIVDAISIRERPAEVEDRAIPGHWEGDLLGGTNNSHIATLVERHSRFVALVKVHPQSPRERGSNENTNGLLRQYFPKRTDLSGYTQAALDKVALRLNQRPRKTLGFETPASRLRASVASTH